MTRKSILVACLSMIAFCFGVASAAQVTVKITTPDSYELHPVEVEDLAALIAHLETHCVSEVRLGISVQGTDDDYISERKSVSSLDAEDFDTLIDSGRRYSHFVEANGYDPKGDC